MHVNNIVCVPVAKNCPTIPTNWKQVSRSEIVYTSYKCQSQGHKIVFFNVIVLLQPTNNYYMIWMRPYVCHLGLKWLWSGFHTCKSIIDMVSQYCSGWVGRGIQPLASPQPLQHTHTQYQLQHHKCAFFAFFNWTWWADGQIDKPTHQRTNEPTDRRTNGPTDAQTKPFMQCNNQVKKGPPQKTFPF